MTVAKARILQWSFVWPLSKTEKARRFAQEVARAGELRINGVEENHIGFVRLLVFPDKKDTGWYTNIRPLHFGGMDATVFDFNMLRFIEFEYCHKGIPEMVGRHPWDFSTYLTIKSVR